MLTTTAGRDEREQSGCRVVRDARAGTMPSKTDERCGTRGNGSYPLIIFALAQGVGAQEENYV